MQSCRHAQRPARWSPSSPTGTSPSAGAVPADVVRACRQMIWSDLGQHGVTEDPATWTEPVVRIACPEGGPFAEAGTRPALWEAFDQLIGAGRWWHRQGVGGTIPVRFPSVADPGDAGWHIEASYERDGHQQVNINSRARGLLVLYLFSDVDEASAPTRSPSRVAPGRRPGAGPGRGRRAALGRGGVSGGRRKRGPADDASHRRSGRRVPLPPVPGPRRLVAAPGTTAPHDGPARRRPAHPVPADGSRSARSSRRSSTGIGGVAQPQSIHGELRTGCPRARCRAWRRSPGPRSGCPGPPPACAPGA